MYNISSFPQPPGSPIPDYTDVIQSFTNQLFADGGGTLFLPRGVYGIRIVSGTYSIKMRPNVSYLGEGVGITTIKLLDNQGNYVSMFGHDNAESADNINISGITFDQNRQNNPITYADGTAWIAANKPRMVLAFSKARRLKVCDCRFMNCDNINTLVFSNPTAVSNVWVEGNEFDAGNSAFDHDHSAIYADGARVFLRDNIFAGVGNGARAAFDLHNTSIIESGNIVEGFAIGNNVVSSNTIISDNILNAITPNRTGYGSTLEKLSISNNL
jgi:hypothetical protein